MNCADPAAAQAPLLISDVAAAELLGISRATLHRLRAAGRFVEPVRLGRALRFRRAEVAAWAEAGCPALSLWREMREAEARRARRAV